MNHIDAATLALIALGEPAASEEQLRHLQTCDRCADELSQLVAVVTLGRAGQDHGDLEHPDPRVWAAISEQVGSTRPLKQEKRPIRRGIFAAIAALVVGILALGGGVVWNVSHQTTTVAAARLAPLPAWDGAASGSAVVVRTHDGHRELKITLHLSTSARYRQAWLMTPDLKHFIRIGEVDGMQETLDIPPGVDLEQYSVVDISDEPRSTVVQPSDNSIVRGTLK